MAYAMIGAMKQQRSRSSTATDILTQQLGGIHFLPHTELITDYNMNWLYPTSHYVCNSEDYPHAAAAALPMNSKLLQRVETAPTHIYHHTYIHRHFVKNKSLKNAGLPNQEHYTEYISKHHP
jgi:hypothetical protein